ncbi:MAG: hypothetical protein WKG07_45105 [Hymenobacter sp.]
MGAMSCKSSTRPTSTKLRLHGAYAVDSAALLGGAARHTYRRLPGHDNAPVLQLDVLSARRPTPATKRHAAPGQRAVFWSENLAA